MTETVSSKTTLLDAFLKQREKRQNDVGIQAQKLVNLYRHLALFGDEFLEKYNKMLLDASAEVQMTLNDIMGGTVVRQYLEFLKGKLKKTDSADTVEEETEPVTYGYEQENAYLPTVDEVTPFMVDENALSRAPTFASGTDPKVVEQLINVQTEFFEKALQKQTEFLNAAVEKMQKQTETAVSSLINTKMDSSGTHLDLVEFQKTQQAVLETLIEKQNEQLNDSLKQVLENTQEISAIQVAAFERMLKAQGDVVDKPYPIIEEYVPNSNFVPESIKNAPVPPRAYHPEEREDKAPVCVEMDSMTNDEFKIDKEVDVNKVTDANTNDVAHGQVTEDIVKSPSTSVSDSPDSEEGVEILSEIDLPSKPV